MAAGEFAFIEWIRRRLADRPGVLVGPGDDCAVLPPFEHPMLATTDMLMDGVDFVLNEVDPIRVGRKAMAVNLSDIAAMAGTPRAALVSLSLPRIGGRALAERLFEGMSEMAERFDVPIVGGDTNSWDQPLVISITILGDAEQPIRRDGARTGHWAMVTGPLGGSIRGRHLDFIPRVREARELLRFARPAAMIDVSDGLAADVGRLCNESRCGVRLDAESIPISPDANRFNDRRSPLDHALYDGEDFELLFAIPPADGARLIELQPVTGVHFTRIGEFVADGLWLNDQPLPPGGWEHELT